MSKITQIDNTEENTEKLKRLVIAEKPSVAADLVNALPGRFKNNKSYYEGQDYVVSFAVGHLVTICTPPEIDQRHKTWSLDLLPIIPDEFPLKALEPSKSQLNILSKLSRRRDICEIINACDAGREGELIFRYILQYVQGKRGIKKKLSRLWLQSMTKESILEGFRQLRTDEEMKPLEAAAICRSEADWLIGINGSRALTGFKSKGGGFHLTPCGRVQTPTLSIIMNRENERRSFISQKYWEIFAAFSNNGSEYIGKWFNPDFAKTSEKSLDKADRLWDIAKAEQIKGSCEGKNAKVSEQTKPVSQSSPPLYDLTTLQREANNRYGYSAKGTLEIIQSLYDRKKMVTYPRTDSRCLPENYLNIVKKVTKALGEGTFGEFAKKSLDNKWLRLDKRIFNNEKVTDHHAIIPTHITTGKLNDREQKIYNMITQRFLAVFYPPARYLNTFRISVVEKEHFKTEGKILKDPGWRQIYGIGAQEELTIPPLEENSKVQAISMEIQEQDTKPQPRFTEATLLSVMESAGKLIEDEELREAMKERGLGTAATRSTIIEGLINDRYIVRQSKDLVPTAKSAELLQTLNAMDIEELTSPELTGEWEYNLEEISKGRFSREEFMKAIRQLTMNTVKKVKGFDENADAFKKAVFKSPIDGQTIYETITHFQSENQDVRIRRFLGGRLMSHDEIHTLLKEKKIGPLTGFLSKAGKPFSAMITLTPENKVAFVFQDNTEDKPDFSKLEIVGESPVDKTKVYEGEFSYFSESAYDKGSKSGLKINKIILGKEITRENFLKMLIGEPTSLIKGFQSSRTKRNFDAYLSLSKNGKITFSFPTRTSQKKTKKAT